MKLDQIILNRTYTDESSSDGKYDIKFHRKLVHCQGVDYEYYSSGLCRTVYISPCRSFVLKVPNKDIYDEKVYDFDSTPFRELPWSVCHNILEFMAYQQCPDEYKPWFAKTELLPFGWLKQEFVEVVPSKLGMVQLREIGIKTDGQRCLFDYDAMFDHDDDLTTTFDPSAYQRIIRLISK